MSFVAHTGIFHKKSDSENMVIEEFDDKIRELINKVISEKTSIIFKTNKNIYIFSYSEDGPFQKNAYITNEWLPLQIYKLQEWYSGGIKNAEFEKFLSSNERSITENKQT